MALSKEEFEEIRRQKKADEMYNKNNDDVGCGSNKRERIDFTPSDKPTTFFGKLKGKFIKSQGEARRDELMKQERELVYQRAKHKASLKAERRRAQAEVRLKYDKKIKKKGGGLLGGFSIDPAYGEGLKRNLGSLGDVGVSTGSIDKDVAALSGVSMGRRTKLQRRTNKKKKKKKHRRGYDKKLYDDPVWDLI